MLLWHDGLDYNAGSTYFAAQYPSSVGISSGAHQHSGKQAIASSNGFFRVDHATPSGFGSDTATVGFYLKLETGSVPAQNSTFLEFKTSGGTTKLLFSLACYDSGFRVECRTKTYTPELQYNKFYFVEIKTTFSSSQGRIVMRVNGTEVSRVENIDTSGGVAAWAQTVFTLLAPPAVFRISDLYVCDGTGTNKTFTTFLGPISSRKHAFVTNFNRGWGPVNTGKYRLVFAAGQSNIDGGSAVIVPAWRNPTPMVPIWNTGTNAWEPMNAGVNTWGHLYFPASVRLPWVGFEMAFAERVAQFYEASGASSTNVRVIKLGVGASTVIPGNTSNSWHPTTLGLHSQAVAQVQAAVAALGGAGNIESMDLFWYQGETETFWTPSVETFPGLFYDWTLAVLTQFAAAFSPISVRFHLVRIHRYFSEVFPDMVGKIRSRQEYLAGVLNIPVVSVDDLKSDGTHIYGSGVNSLGDLFFDRWLEAQDFPAFVQDETALVSPDGLRLGSHGTKSLRLSQSQDNKLDLIHSPVLSVSPRMFCEATPGTLTASLGGKSLGTIPVGTLSPWAPLRQTKQGVLTPEQAAGEIELNLQ